MKRPHETYQSVVDKTMKLLYWSPDIDLIIDKATWRWAMKITLLDIAALFMTVVIVYTIYSVVIILTYI